MSGRILIVDTVATNRIMLKAKMLAAQFSVDACASSAGAEAAIANKRPDLILINLSDQAEDRHDFCRRLKSNSETAPIAIISVGVADTSRARFAALDAGADDVLPRPISDALLLARIRSLLRVRSADQELLLRESTSRALGFAEASSHFETAAHIALMTQNSVSGDDLTTTLQTELGQSIRRLDTGNVLAEIAVAPAPDLFIIDGTQFGNDTVTLFGLVSDLRSRSETRLSTQLIIVPQGKPEIAAMFLDLGADDIVSADASTGEIALRAKALIRRKLLHDRLRDTVRNGLQAAITDPLTGLYNRRYVEPHLARIAEQARLSGQEFAMIMLDIDHFKAINDTYGHKAGDHVLIQLANRLRENLRAIDLVARVGGEEFLIAMPRTNARQVKGAAHRLCRLVNSSPFCLGELGDSLRVTVSLGVALSGRGDSQQLPLSNMYDRADAALYAAKSAGRDRVAISNPVPLITPISAA